MISKLEKTILYVAVTKDLATEIYEEKQEIWSWATSLLKKFN